MSDDFPLRYFCACGQMLFKSTDEGLAELQLVCPSRHHARRTDGPRLQPVRVPADARERPKLHLVSVAS